MGPRGTGDGTPWHRHGEGPCTGCPSAPELASASTRGRAPKAKRTDGGGRRMGMITGVNHFRAAAHEHSSAAPSALLPSAAHGRRGRRGLGDRLQAAPSAWLGPPAAAPPCPHTRARDGRGCLPLPALSCTRISRERQGHPRPASSQGAETPYCSFETRAPLVCRLNSQKPRLFTSGSAVEPCYYRLQVP